MKTLFFLLFCTLFVSCCKMHGLVGKTIHCYNIWPCKLTFLSDSTVSYVRVYGSGVPRQNALAHWQYLDSKHIRLTTDFTHRNIPISVDEKTIESDSIRFILKDTIDREVSSWICLNNKRYRFDGKSLTLARADIGEFLSFYIVALADVNRYAPLLNNDEIQTVQYNVHNNKSNVFEITQPSLDNVWFDGFYYQGLDHILKLKHCGEELIWLNPGPIWNWNYSIYHKEMQDKMELLMKNNSFF